jgi:hypothetical protein
MRQGQRRSTMAAWAEGRNHSVKLESSSLYSRLTAISRLPNCRIAYRIESVLSGNWNMQTIPPKKTSVQADTRKNFLIATLVERPSIACSEAGQFNMPEAQALNSQDGAS